MSSSSNCTTSFETLLTQTISTLMELIENYLSKVTNALQSHMSRWEIIYSIFTTESEEKRMKDESLVYIEGRCLLIYICLFYLIFVLKRFYLYTSSFTNVNLSSFYIFTISSTAFPFWLLLYSNAFWSIFHFSYFYRLVGTVLMSMSWILHYQLLHSSSVNLDNVTKKALHLMTKCMKIYVPCSALALSLLITISFRKMNYTTITTTITTTTTSIIVSVVSIVVVVVVCVIFVWIFCVW